jgi:hypothetical protein
MMRQLMNNSNNSTRHTPVFSTKKRKHNAKTTSTNLEEKEMASPAHRKQRQQNELEIMDPPSATVPLAIAFGDYTEDIDMDRGGNENNTSPSVNSIVFKWNNGSGRRRNIGNDYTSSPIPTTITATNQSNSEFTPVLNGSPNRQSSLERRKTTTTTTNNRYSALQTTSKTKESNKNNNNTSNPSAKDRQDRKND